MHNLARYLVIIIGLGVEGELCPTGAERHQQWTRQETAHHRLPDSKEHLLLRARFVTPSEPKSGKKKSKEVLRIYLEIYYKHNYSIDK
jgi:hypothetical protein